MFTDVSNRCFNLSMEELRLMDVAALCLWLFISILSEVLLGKYIRRLSMEGLGLLLVVVLLLLGGEDFFLLCLGGENNILLDNEDDEDLEDRFVVVVVGEDRYRCRSWAEPVFLY